MQNVSPLPVKWQDESDGWHVGHPVLGPYGGCVDVGDFGSDRRLCLIRETPCGTLAWVDDLKLEGYVVTPEFK